MLSPEEAARECLRKTIEHLEYYSACPWCECGAADDDGGDKPHTEECPLFGYDETVSIEVLKTWLQAPPK